MNKIDTYKALATRNGWSFSMDAESNRPYFMKDGNYAIPDDTTTEEDKKLLASIISEGSDELKNIVLMCWDNDIIVTGPCSGIREYHIGNPHTLHLGLIASSEIITPLYQNLSETFPAFGHYYREKGDMIRYDLTYALEKPGLAKEESEEIFKYIGGQLKEILGLDKEKEKAKH